MIELKSYTCNPPAFTMRGHEVRQLAVAAEGASTEGLRGASPFGLVKRLTLGDDGWVRVQADQGVFYVRDGQVAEPTAEQPKAKT